MQAYYILHIMIHVHQVIEWSLVNEACFDKFEKDLESVLFKCDWSIQLKQHIINTSHETLHFQFPLTQQTLNDACTKVLHTLSIIGVQNKGTVFDCSVDQ